MYMLKDLILNQNPITFACTHFFRNEYVQSSLKLFGGADGEDVVTAEPPTESKIQFDLSLNTAVIPSNLIMLQHLA
jgi:hypothetical protein